MEGAAPGDNPHYLAERYAAAVRTLTGYRPSPTGGPGKEAGGAIEETAGAGDEDAIEGALPNVLFGVSDVARLAARELEGDWEASPSAGGASARLSSAEAHFSLTLEPREGGLALYHEGAQVPCATFGSREPLQDLVDQVVDVVFRAVANG
ncbi:hypothetical protein ACIF6K_28365 [Streptomyces sp. NPDC085942]|uniref:hypothetical protein n=1 Tax=Streptomyces sp. NPDC085942 TaxID=3365743 RepID=UPI0037D6E482